MIIEYYLFYCLFVNCLVYAFINNIDMTAFLLRIGYRQLGIILSRLGA